MGIGRSSASATARQASGRAARIAGRGVHVMAGVPRIMRAMFDALALGGSLQTAFVLIVAFGLATPIGAELGPTRPQKSERGDATRAMLAP